MEKKKKWHLFAILAVAALTIYNILPTVIYYSKPLKSPIGIVDASRISKDIMKRVNHLEKDSISYLHSFCKLLKISPKEVAITKNPQEVKLTFSKDADAKKFKEFLPRAGDLIPFTPSQLSLSDANSNHTNTVYVQRNIPITYDVNNGDYYFDFAPKFLEDGEISPLYHEVVNDRILELALSISGTSENAQYVNAVIADTKDPRKEDYMLFLAQNIKSYRGVFGESSAIAKRYYSTFTQSAVTNKKSAIKTLITQFQEFAKKTTDEKTALEKKKASLTNVGEYLENIDQETLAFLSNKEEKLNIAIQTLEKHTASFASGSTPLTQEKIESLLKKTYLKDKPQHISLGDANPLISGLTINWKSEEVSLLLHHDILTFKKKLENGSRPLSKTDKLNQLVYNEVARISRESGEEITPDNSVYHIALNSLTGSKSFLTMKLDALAKTQARVTQNILHASFNPTHKDLKKDVFPIWDYATFKNLSNSDKQLGLLVFTPSEVSETFAKGLKENAVYVVAKGAHKILKQFQENPNSEQAQKFLADFKSLENLLRKNGFRGFSGNAISLDGSLQDDFIFEADDFYHYIIKATREDFTVHGSKKFAVLEFSDVAQRILETNKIETQIHEDLLKWRDEYRHAQVDPSGKTMYDVPKPTANPLLSNLSLSTKKYFRGDERKILHWGLDLSGGKTVQIELRDQNGRVVKDEDDIKQGINELYTRVNKMGVSEVAIRQEGNNITLDFPSAQGLSAKELVKASSMYFHIVNEKFGRNNSNLAAATQTFLQEVWNEAIVTNKKDIEDIQYIAFSHLYGDTLDTEIAKPSTESAKLLYDNGLRLANPATATMSSSFNDSLSKLAIMRGDTISDWQGQTTPLLIVMNKYALEGSNLKNVRAGYDTTRGNFLGFEVAGTSSSKNGQKNNPRDEFHTWTSAFSKEAVLDSDLSSYSKGSGWRMAVVLNGSVISSPTLDSALRDKAMITGSFTQREINTLEADLKAGSLSFAPHILSEKNVSPELGLKDRTKGILATVLALVLVVVLMISYYKFSGVIASIAVIFNLLIMWAALQNIQATITLAGIAGIILTMGMAVDANVLVFERIREEFLSNGGRIGSAIHAGYKKAFSAIMDSNVTTIIAALVLLNFDSGPIKGFAVTLIIGIVSSMFTALFVTKYFFTKWAKNKNNTELKMAAFMQNKKFNFLKHAKKSILASVLIIAIGGYFTAQDRNTILGMDFTGGYSINLEVTPKSHENYVEAVQNALLASGISSQDFQVRQLNPDNNLRLSFGKTMDQKGKPFYEMSYDLDSKSPATNPKIAWIENALNSHGVTLTKASQDNLESSWTKISGQMSSTMRNNAFFGLGIALLCILGYITIRFEFKYAISAIIGLCFDVLVTIGLLGTLHAFGVPVQIDLNTIAALMTIIGYSLNDTIVIFDRIREGLNFSDKQSFKSLVNSSLNITLSRTIMTSSTTLIVLLSLVTLGGNTIFGLALVMIIGVVYGTMSSLFISTPIMLYFDRREKTKMDKLAVSER